MIDRAYLEARRGEHTHYVVPATGEKRCCLCLGVWPCEQSEILDLALAAEDYRKALEKASAVVERWRSVKYDPESEGLALTIDEAFVECMRLCADELATALGETQ